MNKFDFEKYYQKIVLRNFVKLFLLIIFISLGISLLMVSFEKVTEPYFSKIGVTIYPFYDITKEIVGNKFEVVLITPPGAEPHNFEPTPEIIKNLRGIKIIFASGLEIDKWTENMKNVFGDVRIIHFASRVNLIKENNNEVDPHFWLSLENAKKMAEVIKEEMIIFDPKNKFYYEENFENVLKKIEDLQKMAEIVKKEIKVPYLITQHNAFNYLAKELNLDVIGSLEGAHRELTPKELKNIIDKVKLKKVKVIFKEPGEESTILQNLAKELNLKIFELDPIEGKSGLDYFSAYRKNLETLRSVLK